MVFTLLIFFALGAIIASFVGVIVARLNTGQGFLAGRSHCDACNATLASNSLIPIFSYFAFGGRAGCCGARISPIAPVSEILLGALFAFSYLKIGFTFSLLGLLISLSLLLALVLYDFSHKILPTTLLTIFVISSTITRFLLSPSLSEFMMAFVVALLIALFLALIHFFSRGRAMGLADTPFVFGLSLLVGASAFAGFIFSFWVGAVIGIVILLKRPKGTRMGIEVPFAPFLAAGFLLAYFTQWNPFIFVVGLPL